MVTATTAAATQTSAVATNPGASILKTLNAGSGIDTASLVTQLAAATRATADSAIQKRTQSNSAQVSALAQVRSGLDSFVSALASLSADANLAPQPASTDIAVVAVALDPAVHTAQPFSAAVTVSQLAASQTLVSPRLASAAAPIGQGTLTLTLGMLTTNAGTPTAFTAGPVAPLKITIGPANDSLTGVRDALNAASTGVTASILNDGQGAHLVLKGQTGAASAFTLTTTDAASNPDSASLATLAFAPGQTGSATLAATAANARFTIDGVAIERASNRVSDAVAGYTMTLNAASPDATVTLSSARDTGLLKAAVQDYVAAYNSLAGLLNTDAATGASATSAGPLYGQSVIEQMRSQLATLSSHTGGGTSLAALGVKTGRDGTLTIDDAMLTAAAASDSGEIHHLFAGVPNADGSASADTGLAGTLKKMRDALGASDGGFTSYSARLSSDASTIASDTTALDTRITGYTARLSAQFAAMNAAVAAYKSTSSFLTQQIDAWNNTRTPSAVTA